MPAAAEILASDRLSEFSGTLIDPNASKGNGIRHRHARRAGHGRADQGRYRLHRHRRSRRICRRQTGDEPEAGSQHAEGRRQQRRLSGQGRREDQRPAGLAGLSQAERGRCRHQAAGNAGRRQPRAPRARSRAGRQRRDPDQGGRQDRRSRQPRRDRGRSYLAEARQHPAGLGQAAGQVGQGDVQRREKGAIDPVPGHRRRWRRRLDQGLAGNRPERRV